MNSRERFLCAMGGGQPDRVPCTPDFSNMIPCRLTGKPFWDIYLHQDPPLWQAYLHAADHFGIDAWFYNGQLDYLTHRPRLAVSHEIVSRSAERIVQRHHFTTPDGDLTGETTYYVADPPTPSEKPIKDLAGEFAKLRHFFQPPDDYDTATARRQCAAVGGRHAFGSCIGFPGFQSWMCLTQGGVEPLAVAAVEQPELLDELCALQQRVMLRQLEFIIDSRLFDYVLLGGSGAVTLASPTLFDRYALPAIQAATRLCRQAGLKTVLHSCGKEAYLVQRCAELTDLDCVNPLEIPPMGDCHLAELKRRFGHQIALMGNLHTTEVMLRGTVAQVEAAARQAIADAGAGGGFILSTGDQCGRDTPDENLRALVRVCATDGRYA
jgi:uroporphyrinogen decarboxylase